MGARLREKCQVFHTDVQSREPQVKSPGAFPEITLLFSKVSRKCVHTGHAFREIIHHFPTTVKAVFTWGGYSLKVTSYL